MAEHMNQAAEEEMSPFNAMGSPIGTKARQLGYSTCRAMGLTAARARECVGAVATQLEKDKPYEAQAEGMKHLDLTGVYRLIAVLLTAESKAQA